MIAAADSITQGNHQIQRRFEASVGVRRCGAANDDLLRQRQSGQIELPVQMRLHHAGNMIGMFEGELARPQLHIRDRQRVLIGRARRRQTFEGFRGRIRRGNRQSCAAHIAEHTGQAEVADLGGITDDHDVLGLNVAVMNGCATLAELMLIRVEVIDRPGAVFHVPQ